MLLYLQVLESVLGDGGVLLVLVLVVLVVPVVRLLLLRGFLLVGLLDLGQSFGERLPELP